MQMPDQNVELLFSSAEIEARNMEIAQAIARDMGPEILVIAILKGSFVFAADLIRSLHHAEVTPQIDFMTLSSYGSGTTSSGEVTIHRDVSDDISGRRVLLIDDILESGRTLAFAKKTLVEREAEDVRICVLLDKKGQRVNGLTADYVGFECPNQFVVGYGLDYNHFYRELPFIGTVRQH
jgi:hypoxanthine phosphoribosyltransferase